MGFRRRAALLSLLIAGGCVSREDGGPLVERAAPLAPEALPVPAAAASAPLDAPAPVGPSIAATIPGTERIEVVGRSFSGLWKVTSPKRLGMEVGLFSGVHIRYSGESGDRDICELRQTGTALDARCLRLSRIAAGSIDGDEITLRSWVGPATLVLKARAPSGSFLAGTIGGGALGVQVTGGVPILATKLVPPPTGTEGPSAALVRDALADIAAGRLTPDRYGPEATARLRNDLADMRSAQDRLGPIQSLTYLDRLLPRHPYDPQERPLEVYRIDYAQGAQLCGISPGPPAAVADFICRLSDVRS